MSSSGTETLSNWPPRSHFLDRDRFLERYFENYMAGSITKSLVLMRHNWSEMLRRVAIRREFRKHGIDFDPDTLTARVGAFGQQFKLPTEIREKVELIERNLKRKGIVIK